MEEEDKGQLIWITGLPGSGKTTIAKKLVEYLKKKEGISPVFIDGDHIRDLFGNDLGHDMSDRLKNAYRIAQICQFLTNQGFTVICSTCSLFHEIHEFNRKMNLDYYEILLSIDSKTLIKRDQKNLYQGDAGNVWNKDQVPELPKSPHLKLENETPNI